VAEGAQGGWRGWLARVSFDQVRHRAIDVEGGEFEVVRSGVRGMNGSGVLASELVLVVALTVEVKSGRVKGK